MNRMDQLLAPIDAPGLHPEQLAEAHRETLRALCPVDDPLYRLTRKSRSSPATPPAAATA